MTRYKLYLLKPELATEEVLGNHRFVRSNPFYTLIYTNKRKPKGAILVERPEVLYTPEKAWVMACNMQIEEELFQTNEDAQKAMQSFLSDLEAELKAEQEALKKEA